MVKVLSNKHSNQPSKAKKVHKESKHKVQTKQKVKKAVVSSSIKEEEIIASVHKVQYGYTVGHLEPITQLQALYTGGKISYSHSNFYSCCEFKIYVWDLQTEKIVNKIHHEGEEIVNFAVNIDGAFLATYTSNNLLRLLDVNDNYRQIAILKLPHYFPIDMAFSPNGKYLALGCVNSHVKIVSVPGLKQTHDHKSHSGSLRKIQWHPRQLLLQSIDENGLFVIFDIVKNKVIHKIENFGITFGLTNSGNNIVSVGEFVTVLDGNSFKSQYRIQLQEPVAETMCIFGKAPYLLLGGQNRNLCVLHMNDSNHTLIQLDGLYQGTLVKIMPLTETTLALVTSEQNISIVQFKNGAFVLIKSVLGYNDEILDIKFSKTQGSNLDILAMATNSSLIKLWNTKTKETRLISGHKDIVLGLSFAYPWLASAGKDNVIKLWKFSGDMNVRLIATYKGHTANVTNLSIGILNSQIVSVSEDKTIKVWILQDFETPKIIKNSTMTVMAHDKVINAVKWSPDEELIASCSQDKLIKIWSKSLELKMTLKGHRRGVWDVNFHPQEKIIASVSADGSLKIWNIITGQCVSTMGQGQAILKAQWLFNNQVATATADGILKVWDIRKTTSVSFDNHIGRIWAMDVSLPNSQNKCNVITAGVDSKILLWKDLTQQKMLQTKMLDEKQQRTKLTYNLAIQNGDYKQAAKLAFNQGYDELFVRAVQGMQSTLSQQTLTKVQGDTITFQSNNPQSVSSLNELVEELIKLNLTKFLKILQNLNGISRYFKISNKMLYQLLRYVTVTDLLELQKSYHEQKKVTSLDEFNRKDTDFQNFLTRFQFYNQRHSKRLDQYHKKSYWMDYQSRKQI